MARITYNRTFVVYIIRTRSLSLSLSFSQHEFALCCALFIYQSTCATKFLLRSIVKYVTCVIQIKAKSNRKSEMKPSSFGLRHILYIGAQKEKANGWSKPNKRNIKLKPQWRLWNFDVVSRIHEHIIVRYLSTIHTTQARTQFIENQM